MGNGRRSLAHEVPAATYSAHTMSLPDARPERAPPYAMASTEGWLVAAIREHPHLLTSAHTQVSAAQFLCEEAAGMCPSSRAACCMRESRRVLGRESDRTNGGPLEGACAPGPCGAEQQAKFARDAGAIGDALRGEGDGIAGAAGGGGGGGVAAVFQYHPEAEHSAAAASLLRSAARAAGFAAAVVLDPTHHTSACRWYLYAGLPEPGCPTLCSPTVVDSGAGGDGAAAATVNGAGAGAAEVCLAQTCGPPLLQAAGEQTPYRCTGFGPACSKGVDACCVSSLAQWAGRHGLPVPRLPAAHVAFVENQHAKMAHQLLRKWRRLRACTDGGGTGDDATVPHGPSHDNGHLPQLSCEERASAEGLWRHFGAAVPMEEIKVRASLDAAMHALHGEPGTPD